LGGIPCVKLANAFYSQTMTFFTLSLIPFTQQNSKFFVQAVSKKRKLLYNNEFFQQSLLTSRESPKENRAARKGLLTRIAAFTRGTKTNTGKRPSPLATKPWLMFKQQERFRPHPAQERGKIKTKKAIHLGVRRAFLFGGKPFGIGPRNIFAKDQLHKQTMTAKMERFWFKRTNVKQNFDFNLSVFDKMFQKHFAHRFFRGYFPYVLREKLFLVRKLKRLWGKARSFYYQESKVRFGVTGGDELLYFIEELWPGSPRVFHKFLLAKGFIATNNSPAVDSRLRISAGMIGSVAIRPALYLILSMLFYKFSTRRNSRVSLAQLRAQLTFSFMEFSFNSGEFYILKNIYESHFKRNFVFIQSIARQLLRNRFYFKQKRFGLGRLL
jgi:hypothetical protein